MGDAQSAQREDREGAAAEVEEEEEEAGAPLHHNIEDKPLRNNGQISEINGKVDSTVAEVDYCCEEEVAPEEKDVAQTSPENIEINQKESLDTTDVTDELPLEMTTMDTKQNDINESFKRFFSNIGLKLTVKRGSDDNEALIDEITEETSKKEPTSPGDTEDSACELKTANAEQSIDQNTEGTNDGDSTTCPTLTDGTSEDALHKTKEDESQNVVEEVKTQQDEPLKEDTTSPSSPEAEEVLSPVKKFFTTGIFSGLKKKKKQMEDEITEKELVDMGGKDKGETTEVKLDQEEKGQAEPNEAKEDDEKLSPTSPVTITVNEPETPSAQEKAQDSPLKWFLSGSGIKKISKKQKGRKSSTTMLSDSEEPSSDQPKSPAKSPDSQQEEKVEQPQTEAAEEESSAWASFKKLVTPKKQLKTPSLTSEELQIPAEETKPSDKEYLSDHSTEEGKKRKDSSWEAVLCGSGRRRSRSRKTSDSEDESPHAEDGRKKQESPLASSNEVETSAVSPKAGSPAEGDGGSTWKSFKKLVTPKRKARDEEESKDNIQSDGEAIQDDSSFSIKKLLPRKKKKSVEHQDQLSSDEADKEAVSGDEDSDTPAVVPLSEFDIVEFEVQMKTKADVENHEAKEPDQQLQQDLLDQTSLPVLPQGSQQTETKEVQEDKGGLEIERTKDLSSNKKTEDHTELISKHQQLSDIPEEGVITETNATPDSVSEEAARDDTIAEDLIEIISDAATTPEPLDFTTADETEMVSAISQLPESSKTSGDTTPVPVEYDIPEKGVTTETNATRETVSEEEARDDTIAEDLIEITSDAITTPEPLDITTADETELVSAVSQLPESSKTSGDATPVPVEYDIPEKGVTTETNATREAVSEEAAQDDTIAEDLIEITSDAITTPESLDFTTADETEMVSAVSQVPESSKTSDDTTPVPVEYDILETGVMTETNATREMVSEEAAGDDTIAEDLIEITADAITTQEPLEFTTADETEMVYAVSQLPESSKTSGDNTPVPVENDIPEKGVMTETNVTRESFSEEPAGDDTIAEDLIEITPDALTTPEPLDITIADETEMVSAVSQLPETSKTSDDTTPVPVEYDILEKGVITETNATKEMVSEEAAGDDTIAEDLIEITSDAITTPELFDITTADETEMVSAASQLPESSKTSGNTTPVPVEYEVKTTEVLLNQVLEVIATSSIEIPVCSDEVSTESMVGSVSPQILEKCVEEPAVLEMCEETDRALNLRSQAEVTEAEATESQQVDSQEAESSVTKLEEMKNEGVEDQVQTPTQREEQIMDHGQDKPAEVEEEKQLRAEQEATLDSDETSGEVLEKEEIPEKETVTDKATEEPGPDGENQAEAETEIKQEDTAQTRDAEEPKTAQTTLSDLDLDGAQILEVIRQEVPAEDTVTEKPDERPEPVTETLEAATEIKEKEDTVTTEHAEEPEESETELKAGTELEEDHAHLQEEQVISDVSPAEDTDTPIERSEPASECKKQEETDTVQPKEKTEPLTEKTDDKTPADAADAAEAVEAAHVEEPGVSDFIQTVTSDSEVVSAQLLNKEGTDGELPAVEMTIDEPKEEIEPESEGVAEANEAIIQSKTATPVVVCALEDVQDPMLDSDTSDTVQSAEKKGISDTIIEAEITSDEPKQEPMALTEVTEKVNVEEPHVIEDAQGPLLELVEEAVTEPEGEVSSPDQVPSIVDAPKPDTTDSVSNGSDTQVEPEKNQDLHTNEDQQPEISIPDVAEELQTLTGVHLSTTTDEASVTQVREIVVLSETYQAPSAETAIMSHEPDSEVNLSTIHSSVNADRGEIRGFDIRREVVEHAVVTQVTRCYLKEVAPAIPNALIETTSESSEPLIDSVASELGFSETNESATPLVQNYAPKTGEEGSVVKMMNVPSVQFDDNHRIQVQVHAVDVNSAKRVVDTVLEVGLTEAKGVIDECPQSFEEEDKVSATAETEGKFMGEEHKVIIQEVNQQEKENLPEIVAESVPPDFGDTPEAKSREVEGQRSVEDDLVTSKERQDEESVVTSDDSATKQVLKDQSSDSPGCSNVLIHEFKEELKEPKIELKKSEVDGASEESSPDMKNIQEEAQTLQIAQTQIASRTSGVLVPQNTGVISSIGNMDSPSSLSLEFKLNIHFGNAKEPASSPPTSMERTEQVKQTDMADVGVQAVELKEEIHLAQCVEKHADMTDVGVQAVELKEEIHLAQCVEKHADMADVGVQAVEPKEEIHPAQCVEKHAEMADVGVQVAESKEDINVTQCAEKVLKTDVANVGIQVAESKEDINATQCAENVVESEVANVRIQVVESKEDINATQCAENVVETDAPNVGIQVVVPKEDINATQCAENVIETDVANVGIQVVEPKEGINATQCAESVIETDAANVEIQVVEPKVETSPAQPVTALKLADLAQVGNQVVEPQNKMILALSSERQEQMELIEAAVQHRENPELENEDSTERLVITCQPVVLNMHTVEIVEMAEQVQSSERLLPNVQVKEAIQAVKQNVSVGLNKPQLLECPDQDTKPEQPIEQVEEETEQDVWMDAEEDLYNQEETEKFLHAVEEESPVIQVEETVEPGELLEFEMATSRVEEKGSNEELLDKEGNGAIESEEEDFAVAHEDPDVTATALTEWD